MEPIIKSEQERNKIIISSLVKDYILLFPEEFIQFKNGMRDKRDIQLNKFSEIKGNDAFIRELGEYPTTLYNLFLTRLTVEQMEWLKSKKGAHWFFKKFPAFAVANVI